MLIDLTIINSNNWLYPIKFIYLRIHVLKTILIEYRQLWNIYKKIRNLEFERNKFETIKIDF